MAALLPTLSTLLWVSMGPVVAVEGDTVCPTADEVAARVATLLPARETGTAPDLARIEVASGWMSVTLARPDGSLLGQRAIDGRFPCADLAEAAAVMVATWESDVHPEFRPPPAPARPAPPVVAAPAAAAPPRAAYDLGAAVVASLAPSGGDAGAAIGALFVASWAPAGRGLGVRLALTGTGDRTLTLGDGHVRWRRVAAALGPQFRVASATSRWALDLHAEAVAAWLTASGDGFATDRRDNAFDPGAGAGGRVLRFAKGPVVPWLELSAAGWPRRQTAYATPGATSVVLPRFEATLALGLSYRGP